MKHYILVSCMLVLVSSLVLAQEYKSPESAAFYAPTKSYYVSNFGNGRLFQIDSTGAKTVMDSSMTHSLGMIIKENVLYVVSNPKGVKGFDLASGENVLDLVLDESQFLNDITCAGNKLYVTDSQKGIIFEIDIPTKTYKPFSQTGSSDPNGILYDQKHDRLIVCHFKEQAPITAVNLKDKSIVTLVPPQYVNLDGLAIDEAGNIYVSSWGKGSFQAGFLEGGTIYKFDPDFKNDPEVYMSALKGPADIYYNIAKNEMIIPVFLANQVIFKTDKK